MIKLRMIIMVLVVISTNVNATTINEAKCLKVAKQIKTIKSKMRQGYSVKKGEQLMKRLRALKKQRYMCHKARLPTK